MKKERRGEERGEATLALQVVVKKKKERKKKKINRTK